MNSRIASLIALATFAACSGAQVGGRLDQVPPALRLAIRSLPNLKFSGTRNVEVLDGAERVRYQEYVLRDGPRTRIWFPNASPFAGQIIVENARARKHFFPGRNEIEVGPPKREEAFGRLINLLKQGTISCSAEPGGTIAGNPTSLISIRERGNVLQKLWIDAQGMVLRRDLFDMVGARVGHYEFTEIDYSPRLEATDFDLARRGAKLVTQADLARKLASDAGLSVVLLPESEEYQLESSRVLKGARIPVLHLVYIRPGASVSLFQARGIVDLPVMRRAARGMAAVSWNAGGNTFALIGNVSDDEVHRLARLIGLR